MKRVLGISCASDEAFLCVVDVDNDGVTEAVLVGPQKLAPVTGGDRGDATVRSLEQWESTVRLIKPDVVALLLPEGGQQARRLHSQWAPRCEAETLAILAAGRLKVPVEVLPRATVRSRLGVKGKLDDEVRQVPAVGKYWAARGLAFLAGRATAANALQKGWPELKATFSTEEARHAAQG